MQRLRSLLNRLRPQPPSDSEGLFGIKVGFDNVLCRFKWDYPIVNLESGHIRHCCRVPKRVISSEDLRLYGQNAIMNHPYELERRREKLLGITHRDCETCIRLSAAGAPVPRSGTNSWLKDYYIKNGLGLEPRTKDQKKLKVYFDRLAGSNTALESHNPQMLEIVLGNLCDLKCTYCSVHYSTRWASELIQHGEMTESEYEKQFPKAPPELDKVFWEWFYDVARHSVEVINILGGEPTYNPRFYTVLEKVLDAYRDLGSSHQRRVEFCVLTNLNTNQERLDRLLAFIPRMTPYMAFHLQPSIEALDQRAEYIRFGLKWPTFDANLNRVIATARKEEWGAHFLLSFQMAISSLSLSDLPRFLQWVLLKSESFGSNIGLAQNIVSFPKHHSPMILTEDFAQYVKYAIDIVLENEQTQDRRWKPLHLDNSWRSYRTFLLEGLYNSLASHERLPFHLESRRDFYHFIRRNDARRRCDFLATFPDYQAFFRICEREAGSSVGPQTEQNPQAHNPA